MLIRPALVLKNQKKKLLNSFNFSFISCHVFGELNNQMRCDSVQNYSVVPQICLLYIKVLKYLIIVHPTNHNDAECHRKLRSCKHQKESN